MVSWWPQEQWDRMVAGEDCPMCADAHLPANEHGELIAELPGSYARLHINQTHAGYAVLVAKRHAPELYDLTADELRLFWLDVAAVARTISTVLAPCKLDYLVMGHLCPHVHCHIYPQYDHDDPHALINVKDGDVRLTVERWQDRIDEIRLDLATHHP